MMSDKFEDVKLHSTILSCKYIFCDDKVTVKVDAATHRLFRVKFEYVLLLTVVSCFSGVR